MGGFFRGVLIIAFVLVINALAVYVQTGVATGTGVQACGNGNYTTCQSASTGSFITQVLSTTVTGFSNVEPIVNVVWLIIMYSLLTAAAIMIVSSFIPTIPGAN